VGDRNLGGKHAKNRQGNRTASPSGNSGLPSYLAWVGEQSLVHGMLRVEKLKLTELKPWKGNPRVNEQAVDAVAESIKRFGFNVPILCDQNLAIIAGHTRWIAARKLGMKSVPVIRLDLENGERQAFSLADNRTAEIAEWDLPKLRGVLKNLRSKDIPIDSIGFSNAELRQLLRRNRIEEDEIPEPQGKVRSKPGDLWALGNHRVLCGDCRSSISLQRLLNSRQVDYVFAGAPCFGKREYADWDSFSDYMRDIQEAIRNCCRFLKRGSVVVWHVASDSSSHHDVASEHSHLLTQAGLRYLDTIAWIKDSANFSVRRNIHIRRNKCYYPAFRWEPIFVFQKRGRMPKMTAEAALYMLSHQTNVWDISPVRQQMEKHGHPAVCPVELPYRTILAYTGAGGSVLDPFGGSGTTLIAAEKAGRSAFSMERVPQYCDRTIGRWEALTRRKAKRVGRRA
jgi:site-specific DNA-methyltransferase (adenine-specific)